MTSDLTPAQEDLILERELEEMRDRRDELKMDRGMKMCDSCSRWFEEDEVREVKTTDDCKLCGVETLTLCKECEEYAKECSE